MASDASFCLWNSNCHELLACAQDSSTNIHLECDLVWNEEPTRIKMEGQLREVHGREAQFIVSATTMQPSSPKAEVGGGAFYFSVKRQIAQDTVARLGVHGTASVQELSKGPNGELVALNLRFSRHVEIRQLRSGKRIPWRKEYSGMTGVLIAPEKPATTNDLRNLLGAYSNGALPYARIIDISDGGACICIPEDLVVSSFSGDATYLFFLRPSVVPATQPPYVFVAKRVGFGKAAEAEGVVVRLKFQEELDWNAHRSRLHWMEIKSGSPRLRQCLLHYLPSQANPSE